jgi:hypothetical protein
MNILNTMEREAFDSPPMFHNVERKHYFDFPTELRRLSGNPRTPIHRLGFLLTAGPHATPAQCLLRMESWIARRSNTQ